MTLNKQQFMARPKVRALPPSERERRWKQHLMSEGGLPARRNDQRIQGRGDYFSSAKAWADRQLKRIPRGTFGKVGSAIAGAPGQAAGDLISHLTGRGDYHIKKNSLIQDGNVLKPTQMSFSPTGASSIRMRRREFIGDLVAPDEPTVFSQTQYRLQPTDTKTFPWLASVANHFTEWELHGAILTFETTSSNFAQDMALGTVSIATQYNANELPYGSMRDILQAAYHSRGNPSECIMHGIECDPSLQASEHLYTRRFGTSGPPNLYDHGVVTVATEGLPAKPGTILGRLFMTYDIELNLPALPTSGHTAGRCLTLWNGTPSASLPPLGDPLAVSYVPTPNGLTFGTASGNDVMALLPSNGPWARPSLPVSEQASLVGWISDSTITPGMQYLSFANEGTYILQLNCFAALGDNPGDMLTALALTSDVEVIYYTSLGSSGSPFSNNCQSYARVTCICTGSDQSISLTRANASNYATWSVLAVCA